MSEKSSDSYVPEPFPEHELEPYGWHDILATLDVCANVHDNVHCDEEGYDICSLKMLSVMQEIEESELSCRQENATQEGQLVENSEDDSLNSRDESIILEGPNADTSRITTIYQRDGEYVTEVMKYGVHNEISSFERELEEQGVEQDESDEEGVEKRAQELEDFYDASDESFPDSEIESENEQKHEPRLRTRDGL